MRVENESDDVRSQESTWSRLKVLATLYHGFYVFSNGRGFIKEPDPSRASNTEN